MVEPEEQSPHEKSRTDSMADEILDCILMPFYCIYLCCGRCDSLPH